MFGSWLRLMVVLSITAAATQAAPPLTEILDVLFKADGTLFDGIAQIEWKAFQAADGSEVPQNVVNIRVARGNVHVFLVPTTNVAKPVTYTVRFNSDGRTQFTEYWAVPPSATSVKLREIRTHGPIAGNLTTTAVNIADVTGLRNELDLRPTRGATWTVNRAAAIGPTGALEAIAGVGSDCVHVDGTSSPCGSGSGSGGSGGTGVYVDAETPAGALNGSNPIFRVMFAPSPASSFRLYRNGLLMFPGKDYTLSGNAITMAAGRVPAGTDLLQAWYRISGPNDSIVDSEIPAGLINGVNSVFTLAATPTPSTSLQIVRNGLLLKQGVDYTLSGNVVTFVPGLVPASGDILQANYRR